MTRLESDKVALFVQCHRGELTRIWREARAIARDEVFPGLIDGVVESFFGACGDLIDTGAQPEDVWMALGGLVRWAPPLVPAELHREWALVGEVVTAACEAMNCNDAARDWLSRAAAFCRHAMAALADDADQRPPGVVVAIQYSSCVPRRRQERRETDS